jgi:hypothetical protein
MRNKKWLAVGLPGDKVFSKSKPVMLLIVKCRSAVVKSAVFWPNWNRNSGLDYGLNVAEVLSAPSSFFSNLSEPSSAVSAVKKARLWQRFWGNQSGCSTGLFIL